MSINDLEVAHPIETGAIIFDLDGLLSTLRAT